MVKQGENSVLVFILLFLFIIIIITIALSLIDAPKKMIIETFEKCYQDCRNEGHSKYMCSKKCYNKENDYEEDIQGQGPMQHDKYLTTPISSESKGGLGPIEPVKRNSSELLDPYEQQKVNIPEPGIPKTISESYII